MDNDRSGAGSPAGLGLNRWIGVGLLGLPAYGALTFFSSLHPQPDPTTKYDEWSRFVTTEEYVIGHVLGSGLGLILLIFGAFALGAYLANSRARNLGLFAMTATVLGSCFFLMLMGVATFAAPEEGQAHLAGIEGFATLPDIFADTIFTGLFILVLVLSFFGNVLLGVAVWLSGTLPKWAGALWAAAPVLMYIFGILYGMTIGGRSTPPTVLVGAVIIVISGAWMAWSVLRHSGPERSPSRRAQAA